MARARQPADNPSSKSHARLHVDYNLERRPLHDDDAAKESDWTTWFRSGGNSRVSLGITIVALVLVILFTMVAGASILEPVMNYLNGRLPAEPVELRDGRPLGEPPVEVTPPVEGESYGPATRPEGGRPTEE